MGLGITSAQGKKNPIEFSSRHNFTSALPLRTHPAAQPAANCAIHIFFLRTCRGLRKRVRFPQPHRMQGDLKTKNNNKHRDENKNTVKLAHDTYKKRGSALKTA